MNMKQQEEETLNAKSFFKKNWLNILSLVIGAVGVLLAIKFYNQSKLERIPTFVVDPARTSIFDSKILSENPIRVSKRDGTPITSDVTSLRFFFWNQGSQSIRSGNVLRSISFTLEDSSAEILDFRTLKLSRDVTGIRLLRDSLWPSNRLKMDFAILEHLDGISAQIIYEGNPAASLSISGVVEGANRINTKENITESVSWVDYLLTVIAIIFVFLMFWGIVGLFDLFGWLVKILLPKRLRERWGIKDSKDFGYFVMLAVLAILFVFVVLKGLYTITIQPLLEVKQNVKQEFVQEIPDWLLPNK
jgi:hypothetical protein